MTTDPEPQPVAWALVNDDEECEEIQWGKESPLPGDPCLQPLYAIPPNYSKLVEVLARIRDSESYIYSGDDLRSWAEEVLASLSKKCQE